MLLKGKLIRNQHTVSVSLFNNQTFYDAREYTAEYWLPVRQYICPQTTQCKVPQLRAGQYHFTPLSKVDAINYFKTNLLYTHTRVTKDGTGT